MSDMSEGPRPVKREISLEENPAPQSFLITATQFIFEIVLT